LHALIGSKRAEVEALCRRLDCQRLEVVGSAARGHDIDPAHSDADFLVTFALEGERSFVVLLDL
jgi:hypothetical protein